MSTPATESSSDVTPSTTTRPAPLTAHQAPDGIPSGILRRSPAACQTVCYTRTFPSGLAHVGEARRYAMACACDHPRRDDVGTSTSELASNAILYGSGERFTLTVEVSCDDVL